MCHRQMHDVYVGIGSNLGKRIQHINSAIQSLMDLGECRFSPLYETDPVGFVDQPRFLNLVAHLRTPSSPRMVLQSLHDIEQASGRTRGIRFGPRTLDLDMLLYDDLYYCVSDLQIPHPRMWDRAFVMVPLSDLTPLRLGLGGRRFIDIANEVRQREEVHYVGRFW